MSAKSKFKMGPLQKAWVEALCSGKYAQSKSYLCRVSKENHAPLGYCCLGVACEVAKKSGIELVEAIVNTNYRGIEACVITYDRYGSEDINSAWRLPDKVLKALRMHSPTGRFNTSELTKEICEYFDDAGGLAELNDTNDWSLEEIGKAIEKYPELFFNEAA